MIGLPSVSDYFPWGCIKLCIGEGIIRDVREIEPDEAPKQAFQEWKHGSD